jgi:hypothetical protein
MSQSGLNTSSEISENRRAEYVQLRKEIYDADRTCVLVMGFLITVSASAGSASIGLSPPISDFLIWILSPVFMLGFWYFTEKRFVIIRITAYIRDYIEENEKGFGWCKFLRKLSKGSKLRLAIPFDPYHLETTVCGFGVIGVPIYGLLVAQWSFTGWYFISSVVLAILYLILAWRSCRIYGKPLEYELPVLEGPD